MPICRSSFCSVVFAALAALTLATLALTGTARARDLAEYGDRQIGGYVVTTESIADPDHGESKLDRLTITRGGTELYRLTDADVALSPASLFGHGNYCCDNGKLSPPYNPGTDFLGVGSPVLVILTYSGGAHCCFVLHIVLLGDQFRELQSINLRDFGEARIFYGWDEGRAPTMRVIDPVLIGFHLPVALSPVPGVELSFDPFGMKFVADPGLMRRPVPSADKVEMVVNDSRASDLWDDDTGAWHPPVAAQMLGLVAHLIYTGHRDAARDVLDRAWVGEAAAKESFWRELTECKLRQSDYWPAIAALNGWNAAAKPENCPQN